MASEWTDLALNWIKAMEEDVQASPLRPFREYSISLLNSLLIGTLEPRDTILNEIASKIIETGQDPLDAWYTFLDLFFWAASSTSAHERFVGLVFAFANHTSPEGASAKRLEVDEHIKDLSEFVELTRTSWNSPGGFEGFFGAGARSEEAWININRFIAHLAVQQRRIPTPRLHQWLEDFGL